MAIRKQCKIKIKYSKQYKKKKQLVLKNDFSFNYPKDQISMINREQKMDCSFFL